MLDFARQHRPSQVQHNGRSYMNDCTRWLAMFGVFVASLTLKALPATAQIDSERAAAYFEEAAALCEREGGRIWGVSLCGPMVFADPATGTIATNLPEPEAPRPRVLGYANAALEWGGERWSAFVWPMIPPEAGLRAQLILHELFHRVQPELGLFLPTTEGAPDHLDTHEGRYWIQLEWRALANALSASGSARHAAIRDALAFRAERRSLFAGAEESERVIEINEGLAQYTGTVAAAASAEEATADVVQQLARAPEKESFVRTFAYPSGAAYGILLDKCSPGWTREIAVGDDLGDLLMAAANLQPSENAEEAAGKYGGSKLWDTEAAREAERGMRVAALRRQFVDGPVLVLPRGRNAAFITTGVTPIPGAGTILPSFRVSGEWGRIEADQVLISEDGSTLTVPAPDVVNLPTLSGDGWTVTLEPGWIVRPGPREGDLTVVRQDR